MATRNSKKNYRGAGVLIFDIKTSSFLLVHDYTNNYNCCGGWIKYDCDDPKYIEKTARDELYEETRTVISCELERLSACPFVDLNFRKRLFRCYILKMECDEDICERFENFHLVGNEFRETKSLVFFPSKQFRDEESFSQIEETSRATARDGKKYPLNQRVISVLKAAMNDKLLF